MNQIDVMTYTITINNTDSDLAKNLLKYLQSLSENEEYNFLQIIEGEDTEAALSKQQKEELDNRYEHFLKHHDEYAEWEDIKHKYIKK